MFGHIRSGLWLLLVPLSLEAQPAVDEMPLTEAIDLARGQGAEIAYSTRLVQDWMHVRLATGETDVVTALGKALDRYDLEISAGRNGRLLIVRQAHEAGPTGESAAAFPPSLPPPPTLDEITVTASHHRLFDRRGVPGQTLNGEEIRLLPHIGDDAFRAIHRLPGVAASDFQAPFHLRGGYADETGVILDGVRIDEPYHMRSLFRPLSLIDPGIIGTAQLQSGGMTADVGDFLSGVLDITSDRIETDNAHEIGVSFLTAFARSKGWFADGRGDYLVSVRRGWLDLIADEVVEEGEVLSPRYADGFARVSYELSPATEVSAHALWSDDDVEFVDPGDGEDRSESGGSAYVWLGIDSEPSDSLRFRGTLFAGQSDSSEDSSQFKQQEEAITRLFDQDTRYAGARAQIDLVHHPRHVFRLGLGYRETSSEYDYRLSSWRRTSFVNGGSPFVVNRAVAIDVDSAETSLFATYRLNPAGDVVVESGLRWDRQDNGDYGTESRLSPRVNALIPLGERTRIRAAWGVFYQPHSVARLDVVDGVTDVYEPEKARHSILGLSHRFASGMELELDVYDKRYSHLRPRFENVVDTYEFAPESNFDRVRLSPSSGRAYGAEISLRRRRDEGLSWWLNYSRSKVFDVVDAEEIPRAWDQRDLLSANFSWQGHVWSAGLFVRYHSGWPRTILAVTPVFDASGNIIGADADVSGRNAGRYESYTRVDARVSRDVAVRKGRLTFYVELFNILDAENPCCTSNHTLNIDSSVSVAPQIDDFLPRFPSFGFIWRFGPGNSR